MKLLNEIKAEILEVECHIAAVRKERLLKFGVLVLWVALVAAFAWVVWP